MHFLWFWPCTEERLHRACTSRSTWQVDINTNDRQEEWIKAGWRLAVLLRLAVFQGMTGSRIIFSITCGWEESLNSSCVTKVLEDMRGLQVQVLAGFAHRWSALAMSLLLTAGIKGHCVMVWVCRHRALAGGEVGLGGKASMRNLPRKDFGVLGKEMWAYLSALKLENWMGCKRGWKRYFLIYQSPYKREKQHVWVRSMTHLA